MIMVLDTRYRVKPYKDIAAATVTETSRSQRQKNHAMWFLDKQTKHFQLFPFFSFDFGQSF